MGDKLRGRLNTQTNQNVPKMYQFLPSEGQQWNIGDLEQWQKILQFVAMFATVGTGNNRKEEG